MQALLLRFLETGEVQQVGATHLAAPVNVRVICATHRELRTRIAEGLFREDLFYRLNVIHVHIPPLRERREDIRPLLNHFLGRLRGTPRGRRSALRRRRDGVPARARLARQRARVEERRGAPGRQAPRDGRARRSSDGDAAAGRRAQGPGSARPARRGTPRRGTTAAVADAAGRRIVLDRGLRTVHQPRPDARASAARGGSRARAGPGPLQRARGAVQHEEDRLQALPERAQEAPSAWSPFMDSGWLRVQGSRLRSLRAGSPRSGA